MPYPSDNTDEHEWEPEFCWDPVFRMFSVPTWRDPMDYKSYWESQRTEGRGLPDLW